MRCTFDLENFEPITAPKTMKEIEQDILNQKKVEIILKNYDEVVRKRLIKYGGTGRIFGFIIKMITNDPINQTRNFMLKYYLDDTNVAIYEYRETNSGKSKYILIYIYKYIGVHRLYWQVMQYKKLGPQKCLVP